MALNAQEQQNFDVVQKFFQSFLDNTLFDYIDKNFDPNIKPRIVTTTQGINNPSDYSDNTFAHELQGLDPLTGLKNGIPDLKAFFIDLPTEFDVVDFQIAKFVVENNNVVVYGALTYVNKETGNRTASLPFFIDFTLKDGKISEYSTYDDTFSFGATARQGGDWRRFWDGEWTNILFGKKDADTLEGNKTEKNVIYGYQGNDSLKGGQNDDVLWGGSGDDNLDGQGGNDTLYGNTGNNTLTGGAGNDVFGIGLDQGNNTITDFVFGEDKLALTGSLSVFKKDVNGNVILDSNGKPILDVNAQDKSIIGNLKITANGNNLTISTTDGTSLAALTGAASAWASLSDEQKRDSFQKTSKIEPNTPEAAPGTVDENLNRQVVKGFFDSFAKDNFFNYIDNNFTDNIRYTEITPTLGVNNPLDYSDDSFTHERQVVLPITGIKVGKEEVKGLFKDLFSEFQVLDFQTDKFVVEDNNVLVFGTFSYLNKATGNRTESLHFVSDITLQDGKISKVQEYYDTYSLAATARQGGEWRRFWDGEWINFSSGTNAAETLTGNQTEKNIIYGYQNNDTLYGGNKDDVIWGGSGNDILDGKKGADTLYGNEGADTFVLGEGNGTDTINDFEKGSDKIKLLKDLSFSQLSITPTNGNTEIKVNTTNEVLAVLKGSVQLDASDFIASLNIGTPNGDNLTAGLNDFDGNANVAFTGAGDDEVDLTTSKTGRNRIFGGSGVDTIYVSKNDRVFGGSGNDIFDATDGQGGNRISGGVGDDTFYLGSGDRALGGEGNDIFYVQEGGNNILTGGAGADQFWVVNAEIPNKPNTITDFVLGTDVVGIGGYVKADLTFGQDAQSNAILAVKGTNVATFLGITQAQLQAESTKFVFG
ncbi:nuclear transport factor 2 family protein [Tolypothrix sp. PCC 7910]|uniref:nuclear transport factor 2 family protein n=1 Tax=Tolypothrix sp. PCC 7910 TaxID=2099387 RepID=UPI0027392DEC|nr:nuclear transport factor 2 family protein [Tolypothrix sp. PCC 7910]